MIMEMVDQYGFVRAQLFHSGLLVHWDIAVRDEIISPEDNLE